MNDDRRLIEDYLPIVAISAEASREKSVRKGHISTLHLWWARRPLVACRAAVYGALVPASQFVPACADKAGRPNGGTDAQKKSLGRANAAKFITSLCQYPGSPQIIKEAQAHILKAHAERLSQETGKAVSVEDIVAGRAPRPRVLDMFAGGGAIPLEALRLGCEAYALDLNPVAYIIQLCTLVYPQKFGKPKPNAHGMTGPRNEKGETTWGGLADEVRYWGNWVLEKVRAEIGDLYPLIPAPEYAPPNNQKVGKDGDPFAEPQNVMGFADSPQQRLKAQTGFLTPVAYLWTRTVQCKNPNCGATVPLVKQTWLCKRQDRYVALKMIAPKGKRQVRFEIVESRSASGLGFDPEAFSKGGNATCPFCGTVADADYVQAEGCSKRVNHHLLAIVCTVNGKQGKRYVCGESALNIVPDETDLRKRIEQITRKIRVGLPEEPISALRPSPNARGLSAVTRHGLNTFGELFSQRQMLCLLSFVSAIRIAEEHLRLVNGDNDATKALVTYLGILCNRVASSGSSFSRWNNVGEKIESLFSRQALTMVWDFAEVSPFGGASGGVDNALGWICDVIEEQSNVPMTATVLRGSATNLPSQDGSVDAVITDPPYYDNVPYADISDFFYVWFKRTIGHLYSEHFSSELTPKKAEATALSSRHGGNMIAAEKEYESFMAKAFAEANRVLKSGGQMTVVYAHKTTLGWATLVDALRHAHFTVTEAWPLDTEMKSRVLAMNTSALASSIFLVARKRDGAETGGYEQQVRPELESIVRERVETLWDMGISGADLVIASVGAGLRAFTRFAHVEYANGEEVPAERFLTEVETVVLETILSRLSKEVGGKGLPAQAGGQYSLASLDTASRFYVLWRYTYGAAELEAGEAIVFANGTHVELEGQHGLTGGNHALVEKKKGKYRLRDFSERGADKALGLPAKEGTARLPVGRQAPLVDALHRTLWLMEKRPTELPQFLRDAQPNREALRLIAQALAGPALKGGEMGDISPTAELSALAKLTANWQSVVEDAAQTTGEKEERKKGQRQLI